MGSAKCTVSAAPVHWNSCALFHPLSQCSAVQCTAIDSCIALHFAALQSSVSPWYLLEQIHTHLMTPTYLSHQVEYAQMAKNDQKPGEMEMG